MVTAGLFMKPERCAAVAYSEPVLCDAEAMLVKKGNPKGFKSYEDVAKDTAATIGAPGGGTEEKLALNAGVPRDRSRGVVSRFHRYASFESSSCSLGYAARFLLPLREKVASPAAAKPSLKARSDEGCWTKFCLAEFRAKQAFILNRLVSSNTPHPARCCAPSHLLPQGEKGRRANQIDQDAAALQVVEAQQQVDERRLAGARTTDNAHLLARLHRQRQVFDDTLLLAIVETDVVETDRSSCGR